MWNIYITKSRTWSTQSTRERKYTSAVQKRSRRLEKRPEKRASFSAGEVAVKITNARVFFNTCTRFFRLAAHFPPKKTLPLYLSTPESPSRDGGKAPWRPSPFFSFSVVCKVQSWARKIGKNSRNRLEVRRGVFDKLAWALRASLLHKYGVLLIEVLNEISAQGTRT